MHRHPLSLLALALLLIPPAFAKEVAEDAEWTPAPAKALPPTVDAPAVAPAFTPTEGTPAFLEDTRLLMPPEAALPRFTTTRPENDDFANPRIAQLSTSYWQYTQGATTEPGEPLPCGQMGATVWFQVTASESGTAEVYAGSDNFRMVIAAYSQTAGTRGALLGCDADLLYEYSTIIFSVTMGRTYYVQVGGYAGTSGDGGVHFGFTPCSGNDNRSCAQTPPTMRQNHFGLSNVGYTLESGEPRPCGGTAATAWHKYTATVAERLVVNTGGSSFDTVLAVYVNNDDSLGVMLACNDDSVFGLASEVIFTTSPGVSYFIQVGGYYGATGTYRLALEPCKPVDHVSCPAALQSASRSTTGFGIQYGEQRPCGSIHATGWFAYTPTTTHVVTVDTAGSNYDTVLAVYHFDIARAPLTCVDDVSGSTQARVTFTAYAGTPYYIQAGGYNGATGNLNLRVT